MTARPARSGARTAPGLRCAPCVGRSFTRLDSDGSARSNAPSSASTTPEQGAFVCLTNALEFHFEAGADPATVRHLVHALLAFTRAVGLEPKALGVPDDPDAFVASIAPKSKGVPSDQDPR